MQFLLGWTSPNLDSPQRNGQLLNELTSDHSSAREELDALQAGHLSWKTQTGMVDQVQLNGGAVGRW